MSDLVERLLLRHEYRAGFKVPDEECHEAAAELTRLRSLNAELVEGLSLLLDQSPVAGEWASGFTTVTYRDDEWDDLVIASNKASAILARANGGAAP